MELNAEQIIKAMEHCTNADEVCEGCILLEVRDCTVHLLKNALALINQLTEENERLKQTITQLGKNNDEIARVYPLAIKEAKADTVREMQERLYDLIADADDVNPISYSQIDQIAKEMLEGDR